MYWILLPIFFGLAFLSKQVPSSYVILSTCLVLFIYIVIKKRFDCLKYILISSAIFIIIIFIIGKIQGVSLDSFVSITTFKLNNLINDSIIFCLLSSFKIILKSKHLE